MLPSSITNLFSNDEKQRFTTTQENVSEDEVIDQISLLHVVIEIKKKEKRFTNKQLKY